MKTIILFIILASVVCLSCTNKRQQFQPEVTTDKVLAESISDTEEEKLSTMLEELRKRLDATTDTALHINAFGNGREGRTIRVDLLLKTPEWEKRFREHIMDSPALRFDGPDGQELCELEGVNQIGNVSLTPLQTIFSPQTNKHILSCRIIVLIQFLTDLPIDWLMKRTGNGIICPPTAFSRWKNISPSGRRNNF